MFAAEDADLIISTKILLTIDITLVPVKDRGI
jgi:hypothetical protein